jgi:hypothetical protein
LLQEKWRRREAKGDVEVKILGIRPAGYVPVEDDGVSPIEVIYTGVPDPDDDTSNYPCETHPTRSTTRDGGPQTTRAEPPMRAAEPSEQERTAPRLPPASAISSPPQYVWATLRPPTDVDEGTIVQGYFYTVGNEVVIENMNHQVIKSRVLDGQDPTRVARQLLLEGEDGFNRPIGYRPLSLA